MSSTRGNIEELFESLLERQDRRAYPRSNSALLTYIDLGDGNGGIALNISEGGVALTAAGTLFADYFPTVRFQLPKIPGWIETSGRVVWVSESRKGAGICFEGIPEPDRERIRYWISPKGSGGNEIEGGANYVSEKKHVSDSGKRKKEPRKLEALSETDEARFAVMFPSESTLQKPRKQNWTETEVGRKVEERISQDPQEIPKNFLLPDTRHEDLSAQPNLDRGNEGKEVVSEPAAQDSELDSPDADPASDSTRPADESVHAILFPRRRWIIDRADDPLRAEDEGISEDGVTQSEEVDSSLDQNRRFPDADKPPGLPLPGPGERQVLQDSPNESIRVEKKPSDEWTLPTFTYPQETDWRQQFDWNRGRTAMGPTAPQAVERMPERSKTFQVAGRILLVAAVCFAGGVIVGNSGLRKLLKLDGGGVVNSPLATASESNSAKSNETSESTAQQTTDQTTGAPREASASGLTRSPNDAGAAQAGTSGSTTRRAQPSKPGDRQESSASNQQPEKRNEEPTSDAVSSSDLGAGPSAKTQPRTAHVPAAMPAVPEAGAIAQSRRNPSTPNYSEATVDRPYSEVQGPILVTPPDEKSGPFRLAFPETAVSASRTLAISAQRFVLIPTQPRSASTHRPERLQAGVLIYHVDPVPPASGEEIGGTVKVRATIGKGGDVVDVKAISGPIPLIPRVVRAVREWRYTVTLLDGQPLGAEEDVVVEFLPKG